MALEPLGAVDDLTAGFLQHFGPAQVVLLVKPGPELHQGQDLLAVLRRPAQGLGDFGGRGQTVDGDFDGQHLRGICRFVQELQKGIHRVIGEEEQPVLLADLGDHGLLPPQILRPAAGVGRIQQPLCRTFWQLGDQAEDIAHIQGALVYEYLVGLHADEA